MERIIQIINHVMKEILRHDSTVCSKQSLTRELLQLGYELDDIDTAFHSLYAVPLFLSEKNDLQNEIHEIKRGQRIFGPAEQKKFSLSFQSEIVRLTNCSLLTNDEIEQVLYEAMQSNSPEVGVRELELLLSRIVKDEERLLLMLPYKTDTRLSFLIN